MLIPTLAALLLLLLAAPAHAVQGEALARALGRAGVGLQFNTGRCSLPGVLGSYSFRRRIITLCSDKMQSARQLYEVLAHEAVHAAQHCSGADTILPTHELAPFATDADLNALSLYDPHERASELEANVLSRASESRLVDLIDTAC